MACPYFCPTEPLPGSAWHGKLRAPLGDAYAGECHARQGELFRPAAELLVEACNLGYAAQQCERFPRGEGPDAVRFSLSGDEGGLVRISYVVEKAHLPYRHGCLEYDRLRKAWIDLDPASLLGRQAGAYLRSYLRWKEQKSEPERQPVRSQERSRY